jgi:hypothetical protein
MMAILVIIIIVIVLHWNGKVVARMDADPCRFRVRGEQSRNGAWHILHDYLALIIGLYRLSYYRIDDGRRMK